MPFNCPISSNTGSACPLPRSFFFLSLLVIPLSLDAMICNHQKLVRVVSFHSTLKSIATCIVAFSLLLVMTGHYQTIIDASICICLRQRQWLDVPFPHLVGSRGWSTVLMSKVFAQKEFTIANIRFTLQKGRVETRKSFSQELWMCVC